MSSPAWLLQGLTASAGTLSLASQQLRFTSHDGRHDITQPIGHALDAAFPRRLWGSGMLLTLAGRRLRFSFTHPDALANASPGDGEIVSGRVAAATWRRRLQR